MTPQRQAIALVLEGDNVHLSAEAIINQARESFPEISMATVYNTLNELVAMGEILEVATGSRARRFDSNTSRAHHHLMCNRCGELHDVHTDFEGPTLRAREQHGFLVTGFNVLFNGLCPNCQALS